MSKYSLRSIFKCVVGTLSKTPVGPPPPLSPSAVAFPENNHQSEATKPEKTDLSGVFSDQNIPSKIKVRLTRPEDVEKVIAYYEANPSDGYAVRDMTAERIANGQAIIAEDEGGQIWGASVTYELRAADYDDHPQHCWSEAGTTRITLNGCNLLSFFFASQALYEQFTNPPRHFVYADIHKSNEAMNYMMQEKVKWKLIPQPQDLHEVCQASLAEDKKGIPVNYYRCGEQELPLQARVILDAVEQGGLMHKSGLKVGIDFSDFPLANEHRPELEKWAARHDPGVDQAQKKAGRQTPPAQRP